MKINFLLKIIGGASLLISIAGPSAGFADGLDGYPGEALFVPAPFSQPKNPLTRISRARIAPGRQPASSTQFVYGPGQSGDPYSIYCKDHSPEECGRMGDQANLTGDEIKGRVLLRGACERNEPHSCARLGSQEISSETGNPERGHALIRKACQLGLNEACDLVSLGD